MNASKVLLIRFSSGGDIVLLTPLIRCIRNTWPGVRLDMVVRADMRLLVENNPSLSNIYALERGFGNLTDLLKTLRNNAYDLVIDAHNSTRSKLIRFLLFPKCKTVFNKNSFKRHLLLKCRINLLKKKKPLIERYFDMVRPLGIPYDGNGSELFISPHRKNSVQQAIQKKFGPGTVLVGIAPGASWPKKTYPQKQFEYIAQGILKNTGCGLILFGGRDLEPMQVPGYEDRVLDLQGTTDVQEAACAASYCRVVLANDSLMLHLAEAVGTNVIALFGPTTAELGYFPHRPASRVFEAQAWCRPCSKNGKGRCFRSQQWCFTGIDPNLIVEEIKKRVNSACAQ